MCTNFLNDLEPFWQTLNQQCIYIYILGTCTSGDKNMSFDRFIFLNSISAESSSVPLLSSIIAALRSCFVSFGKSQLAPSYGNHFQSNEAKHARPVYAISPHELISFFKNMLTLHWFCSITLVLEKQYSTHFINVAITSGGNPITSAGLDLFNCLIDWIAIDTNIID